MERFDPHEEFHKKTMEDRKTKIFMLLVIVIILELIIIMVSG